MVRRVLIILLAVMLAFIALTSFFVLKKRNAALSAAMPQEAPPAAPASLPRVLPVQVNNDEEGIRTFTGIGRIRAQLKGGGGNVNNKTPPTVVVEVQFDYNSYDRAFFEELAQNTRNFRSATKEYFSSLEKSNPVLRDDGAIEAALLERYNSFLRLGKIKRLFFVNFMIID